jgi:hypothetical protein
MTMGMFDSITSSLGGRDAVGGATRSVQKGVQAIGGSAGAYGVIPGAIGNRVAGELGSAIGRAADRIPPEVRNAINVGNQAAQVLQQKGFEELIAGVIEGDIGGGFGGSFGGRASSDRHQSSPTQLYGGITPKEAKRIHQEAIGTRRGKKNLFLVRITSPLMGDFSDDFNLFCTDIEHGPVTITGDKHKIGTAVVDGVSGTEVDEIRMTTLDDQRGTIRNWFEQHSAAAASVDGTVGVPAEYAITIEILHSFVTDLGGFKTKGLFRPVSYEISLSRRDDALEEVQMTFTQLDTFMRP